MKTKLIYLTMSLFLLHGIPIRAEEMAESNYESTIEDCLDDDCSVIPKDQRALDEDYVAIEGALDKGNDQSEAEMSKDILLAKAHQPKAKKWWQRLKEKREKKSPREIKENK